MGRRPPQLACSDCRRVTADGIHDAGAFVPLCWWCWGRRYRDDEPAARPSLVHAGQQRFPFGAA
jgi:hypothetical protein